MKKKVILVLIVAIMIFTLIPYCKKRENKIEFFTMISNASVDINIEETEIDIQNTTNYIYLFKMKSLEKITSRKEWFLAYKEIINTYKNKFDPPETIYDYFSQDELRVLFGVVQAEIGDEYNFEQKCNVASVIFNRLDHEKFGNTISDVLTANQFATVANNRYKTVDVSEDTILACEYAFMIEDTTDGCLFFDSNGVLDYSFVFNDGAHNFYTIKGE